MNIRGYKTGNITALTTAAALFCMPFFTAHAGYQEADADGKTVAKKAVKKIELVEEKAPRNNKTLPKSIVEPKTFLPFDESLEAEQDGFFYLTERDSKGMKLNVMPSSSSNLALDSIFNTLNI